MKKFALFLIPFMLVGCSDNYKAEVEYKNANPTITTEGTFDGCTVKYVHRSYDSNSFYIARCDETTTTTQNVRSGKSSYQRPIIEIDNKINQLNEEKKKLESRKNALSKLTPEELELLGIKESK